MSLGGGGGGGVITSLKVNLIRERGELRQKRAPKPEIRPVQRILKSRGGEADEGKARDLLQKKGANIDILGKRA